MPLVALMALSILAAEPATAPPANPDPAAASQETEDIPPGAPTDDYGFVNWCYGATDEYLTIYTKVLPDLVEIDKTFGSPVKEKVPYANDVAAQHLALKRFAAAIDAAEKATPDPINSTEGQAAIAKGRAIWSVAETLPTRKLADAWLFWGIPVRCERTAKALRDHPQQAMARTIPGPEAAGLRPEVGPAADTAGDAPAPAEAPPPIVTLPPAASPPPAAAGDGH
ncbi:MAG TPA: hypothetical protein VHZ26_02935 [Caulobacteraceae bacterium]|jgi:hypothetical protein|nr:hypothetical protein [Caulobacteraceae bacterium]